MPSLNAFTITAHGADFDVNAFVAKSPLKFDRINRKGEGRNPEDSARSSLIAYLGDGTTLSISDQEQIAVEYLRVNREALRELGKYPGVTSFVLNLQYVVELMPGTVGFHVEPSPPLMWHCLDVGIELLYFVDLDREKEREYLDRWIERVILSRKKESPPDDS